MGQQHAAYSVRRAGKDERRTSQALLILKVGPSLSAHRVYTTPASFSNTSFSWPQTREAPSWIERIERLERRNDWAGSTHWDGEMPQERASAAEETNEKERNGACKGEGELEDGTHGGLVGWGRRGNRTNTSISNKPSPDSGSGSPTIQPISRVPERLGSLVYG